MEVKKEPTDTAKSIFYMAMAIQELTDDPWLILHIVEHCASEGVDDAAEWLVKYHELVETHVLSSNAALNPKENHALLGMFAKAQPGELDHLKWKAWCCDLSNKHTEICRATGEKCPKRGIDYQCEVWTKYHSQKHST